MRSRTPPIFSLGFRPFYLFAALWSALALFEWLLELNGYGIRRQQLIVGMQWHAHEMLFGFAATVITGFSLTAVRAWTGLETPTGLSLALLVLLWLLGRIGPLLNPFFAIFDIAFLPVIAIVIGRLIYRRRMLRNLFLPLTILVLGFLNGLFYLAALGYISIDPNPLLFTALYLITMIEVMIGGRVIPSFTANAVPGIQQFRHPTLAKATLLFTAISFLTLAFFTPNIISAALCFITATLHAILLWGWRPLETKNKPILWILHISYAWLVLGFSLLGIYSLKLVSIYPALHAFGIGATGGLIIGMITRTALGHTGRPLVAGKIEHACYLLVPCAATFWLIAHLAPSYLFNPLLAISGACWCLAFLLYLHKYSPIMFSADFIKAAK